MGLDIYAYRLKKNAYHSSDDVAEDIKDYSRKYYYEEHSQQEIEEACPYVNGFEEELYFRKVNFLYAFFSGLLDETDAYALINKKDIADLIETCKEVLEHHKTDKDGGIAFAEKNLPTCSGFFFGNTEYDKYHKNITKKRYFIEKGLNFFSPIFHLQIYIFFYEKNNYFTPKI